YDDGDEVKKFEQVVRHGVSCRSIGRRGSKLDAAAAPTFRDEDGSNHDCPPRISSETKLRLAAVAQARGHPRDRQMDFAARPIVGVAGTVTAQQFDLQMVERIEVRKAVADASLERRVVLEQR